MEYKRQELHKFFLAHKDEEWYVPGGWWFLCVIILFLQTSNNFSMEW
jgi:hypothetical protein